MKLNVYFRNLILQIKEINKGKLKNLNRLRTRKILVKEEIRKTDIGQKTTMWAIRITFFH